MYSLWLLVLACGTVDGFLVQNGSTGISNTQTTNDRTIQNLLNLMVNEQNSRLQLQSLVTTLSSKVNQLENAMDQIQKSADLKINQTQQEMTKKLNEISARLGQMEQFNADVSRQIQKEKNNRENLEQLYTALEKDFKNATSTTGSPHMSPAIESTLNNITNFISRSQSNFTELDMQLNSLAIENIDLKQDIAKLTNQTDTMFNATGNSLDEVKKTVSGINMTTNGYKGISVGFSLNNPLSTSGAGSDPLKYQQLIYNTGHGYNMSTGIFTCTYAGLYFFTATVFRLPGIRESSCKFHINNNDFIYVSSGAESQGDYKSGSASIVYMLKVGDKVSLTDCKGVDHMYSISSFAGFLISN